jgi:hypothetical protein
MKKENKEMLKTIISNQLLIMKALKIEPVKEVEKVQPKKIAPAKKAPAKKAAKKVIKK